MRIWWHTWPQANIGLRMGDGHFAVDLDLKHNGPATLEALECKHGKLPITPTSKTGGGGRHLIFKSPTGKNIGNSVGIAPGIDIRGQKGFIAAPPSIHENGNRYEWLVDPSEVEIAEAPNWLVELNSPDKTHPCEIACSDALDDRIPEGRRNDTLFRMGASLRKQKYTQDLIEQALLKLNLELCEPPLPESEVLQVAGSVGKYSSGQDTCNQEGLFGLTLADVARPRSYDEEGGVREWFLSPTMAAKAILTKVPLKMALWGDELWWCDEGIWKDSGVIIIERILDGMAGDASTDRKIKETLRRVRNRLTDDRVEFDTAHPYLIAAGNGYTIDLLAGNSKKTKPDDMISMPIDANYDPNAKCPQFLKFLESSCPDVDSRITLIDEIVACACHVSFNHILFLLGLGANGKHVYEEVLRAFFGSDGAEAISLKELTINRFAVSALHRARFCIGTETNPSGPMTEVIKQISGGDWISSDQKNKGRVKFKPSVQLIFDTNAMPRFADETYGFKRRFTAVKMPFRFVSNPDPDNPLEKKENPSLVEKLIAPTELSGLLNLVIYRSRMIARDKKIHRHAGGFEEYTRTQSNSVTGFLEEFCVFQPEAIQVRIPIKELHKKFIDWCDLVVGAEVDVRRFGRMVKKFCNRSSLETTIDGRTATVYPGLFFDEYSYSFSIESLKKNIIDKDIETTEKDRNKTGLKPEEESRHCISKTRITGLWWDILSRYGELIGDTKDEIDRFLPVNPIFGIKSPNSNQIFIPDQPDEKHNPAESEIQSTPPEDNVDIAEQVREEYGGTDRLDGLVSDQTRGAVAAWEEKGRLIVPFKLGRELRVERLSDLLKELKHLGYVEGKDKDDSGFPIWISNGTEIS